MAAYGAASAIGGLDIAGAFAIGAAAGPIAWAVIGVAAAVFEVLDLFGFDLFGGGGGTPYIPPGYRRIAHYPPAQFIGVSQALVPDQHKCNCPIPPEAPAGVSVDRNIDNASEMLGAPWDLKSLWFAYQVNLGPWDYKYYPPRRYIYRDES